MAGIGFVVAVIAANVLLLHAGARPLSPRQTSEAEFTILSPTEIDSYKPYAFYASTGYCSPSATLTWSCGANCDANPAFQPVASGGDGAIVQFWYVGIDLTLKTVVVSHQGTDTEKVIPILTDANTLPIPLNPILFPGIPADVLVHAGFAIGQSLSAESVLAAVQTALQQSGLTKVTLVGHSLGAALSLLDSVYLPLHLPGVTFKTFGYGMPRVGNKAFADYVDSHLNLAHVNNKKDPVPALPPRELGFLHPGGEKHIQEDDSWVACPGQDNNDTRCSAGVVPVFLVGDPNDHSGPYDSVTMGCD